MSASDVTARCIPDDAPATGVCARCGAFVCQRCSVPESVTLRCRTCGAAPVRPPRIAVTALLLAAGGLVCPPLSVVGVALALGWRYGKSYEPEGLGPQYVRWSLWLGTIALVVGGLIYAVAIATGLAVSALGPAKP